MRRLRTAYPVEDCALRMKESLREQRGWLRYEPVRGFVLGSRFRLHIQEHPRCHEDSNRVSCVLYGHILRYGSGSEIRIWEFARGHDPMVWARQIFFGVCLFALLTDGTIMSILVFLLIYVVAVWLLQMSYPFRAEKLEALAADLRYFVQKTLEANEIRGED